MNKLKRIIISLLAGFLGMVMLGAADVFLFQDFLLYIFPGVIILIPFLPVIPDGVGPFAAVGLAIFIASLFWWFIGSYAFYVRDRKKIKGQVLT